MIYRVVEEVSSAGFLMGQSCHFSESYHNIVQIPIGHDAVSEQIAELYSTDEDWTVDEEQVDGPGDSSWFHLLQSVGFKVQYSRCSPYDKSERVKEVLVSYV